MWLGLEIDVVGLPPLPHVSCELLFQKVVCFLLDNSCFYLYVAALFKLCASYIVCVLQIEITVVFCVLNLVNLVILCSHQKFECKNYSLF